METLPTQSSKIQIVFFFILVIFFLFGGINHFLKPEFYLQMIPPFLPFPYWINILSGLAEIFLAILLLVPTSRVWACYGLIALLIAIYPANIYMFINSLNGFVYKVPTWALALRLPFQFVFIYWAWKMKDVILFSK